MVSRDELIAHIWQGRIVSDSAISVRINSARKAVGDNGTEQAIIKTVARRGFKLAVPVTQKQSVTSLPVQKPRRETPDTNTENPVDEKPVLVVFPFECIGAGASPSYLSRGLADDIATELSRFHTIAVISTFSSFQHDSAKMDAHAFAASPGATHIVSGSLQKQGARLRLTVRLAEVTTHTSIWSERYGFDEQELCH